MCVLVKRRGRGGGGIDKGSINNQLFDTTSSLSSLHLLFVLSVGVRERADIPYVVFEARAS